jgi:hypothetical protein
MLLRIAALATALTVTTAAFAREDVKVGSWLITEKENLCYAMASFTEHQTKNEAGLAVSYDAKTKNASIIFSNTKATSIVEGQKLELEILFLREVWGADDGWGTKTFTASLSDGIPYFWSQALDKVLLDDVAKYRTVAFFTDETLISSFDLKGSSQAIAELRKCAFEIAGLNPLDPFLK